MNTSWSSALSSHVVWWESSTTAAKMPCRLVRHLDFPAEREHRGKPPCSLHFPLLLSARYPEKPVTSTVHCSSIPCRVPDPSNNRTVQYSVVQDDGLVDRTGWYVAPTAKILKPFFCPSSQLFDLSNPRSQYRLHLFFFHVRINQMS